MKIYKQPTASEKEKLVRRPSFSSDHLDDIITFVFDEVKNNGDLALKQLTSKYDQVEIEEIIVESEEISRSAESISTELKNAIDTAYRNIYKFHLAQHTGTINVEIQPGIKCWQKPVPISSVGIYIPGGSAPLFSTVLMLAIPASIAGCKEVVLCTPPGENGNIHPAILYAAQLCNVTKICKIGGAQAIAAMTLGTSSVPQVDKIFGPGNQYVTAAKLQAFKMGRAIDMPAGPSEVLVFADNTGVPEFIAADLLSQAEHGKDSQVIMVTTNQSMLEKVKDEVTKQLEILPRKDIASESLKYSSLIYIEDVKEGFDLINQYAPEHFIIASEKADTYLNLIQNAGSVFVGNFTPESAGDYASGTNHTLPTSAAAKAFSGVNLDSFFKKITFQQITQKGLEDLGPSIITMAKEEQLEGHAQAVTRRLKT